MSLKSTPISNRVHIAFFGRRNAGKSSLINALCDQDVALVSPVPGTTTDPVYKAMEIQGIGPAVLIDTPGMDDVGEVGRGRVARALRVLRKTDLAVFVGDASEGFTEKDREFLSDLKARGLPVLGVLTKCDLLRGEPADESHLETPFIAVSSVTGEGIPRFMECLKKSTVKSPLGDGEVIVGDLLSPGDLVVLVIPVDVQAPLGRLILPQVQTLRDILDHDGVPVMCKVHELKSVLSRLPNVSLVITDSQVFDEVGRVVPETIPLTSFSILFARHKGDLSAFLDGAFALDELVPGDRVLIAEACTHHPQEDDIGRVKIPAWLVRKAGGPLQFSWVRGGDFPPNLGDFDVIVHCGGCMLNRKEMLYRVQRARDANVPITNYGMTIASVFRMLPRVLKPFGYELGLPKDSEPRS